MGCDVGILIVVCVLYNFNPRTRMGCDLVSIIGIYLGLHFNPRTRMGCDISFTDASINMHIFQSTHPHGVRLGGDCMPTFSAISIHAPAWGATIRMPTGIVNIKDFNPRTRMGCDARMDFDVIEELIISIHAPAWGATA